MSYDSEVVTVQNDCEVFEDATDAGDDSCRTDNFGEVTTQNIFEEPSSSVIKPFICAICSKGFFESIELTNHVIAHHNAGDSYFSKSNFSNNLLSQGHKKKRQSPRSHFPKKKKGCDIHKNVANFQPEVKSENDSNDGESPEQLLSTENGDNSVLSTPRNDTAPPADVARKTLQSVPQSCKPHVCDICGRGFSDKYYLKRHKHVHEGKKRFTCKICFSSYSRKDNYKVHLNKHRREGLLISDEEGLADGNIDYVNLAAQVKSFRCEICSKEFTQCGTYNRHLLIHSDEKNFICHLCNYPFKRRDALNSHIKIHEREENLELLKKQSYKSANSTEDVLQNGDDAKEDISSMVDGPFRCQICSKDFYHLTQLNRHLLIHTGEKRFVCEICDISYTRRANLEIHMRKHKISEEMDQSEDTDQPNESKDSPKPFSCGVCFRSFSHSCHLHRHIRTHTRQNLFSCCFCEKSFTRKENLKAHLRTHTPEIIEALKREGTLKPNKTAASDDTTATGMTTPQVENNDSIGTLDDSSENSLLQSDQITEDLDDDYKRLAPKSNDNQSSGDIDYSHCDDGEDASSDFDEFTSQQLCSPNKSSTMSMNEQNLDPVVDTEQDLEPAVETTSDDDFQDDPEMDDVHVQSATNISGSNNNDIEHAADLEANDFHEGVSEMDVSQMYSNFHKRNFMDTSVYSSSDKASPEKRFICGVCSKPFFRKEHLQRHLVVHTKERPFVCKVCSKTFSRPEALKEHSRIHSGEKPFKCEICQRGFASSGNLRQHLQIHTDDRKYTCGICEADFYRATDLRRHLTIHTGEKLLQCEICFKDFSKNANLQRHMRVHTGERKFSCEICMKMFSRSEHVTLHKQRVHSVVKDFRCELCPAVFSTNRDLVRHNKNHVLESKFVTVAAEGSDVTSST